MSETPVLGAGAPEEEAQEVRELATRGTPIGDRICGLESAVAAARGHLDDRLLDDVGAAADRATGRLRLSATHTVVAIAGATGSGKSSTFNALTGLELSSTGVRRPTTSWATACVWGTEGAAEVLEWLGIPPRHQTMRESMLDTRHDDKALDGVVLMDLPDHDSTELSHHLEVDRLVELADVLVWVLDPQKYADAAIHDRYLAPFAHHQDVMLVLLNHIDTVPEDRRGAMVDDVRRLLAADGLPEVTVIPIAAKVGIGIDDLRAEIAARAEAKRSTTARAEADLSAAAERLDAAGGSGRVRDLDPKQVSGLQDAVADAAGIPVAVTAVERAVRVSATRATTWPPVAWVLGRGGADSELGETAARIERSGTFATQVQRPVVDTEVRAMADDASSGLGPAWADAVRRAATSRLDGVGDRIDADLAKVDLGVDRMPGWVPLLRILQWLLLLAAVGGGVWWAVLAVQGTTADAPAVGGLPLPAMLLVGGLLLGIVLTLVARGLVGGLARRRAEQADERLRGVVTSALDDEVVGPTGEALATYTTFRRGVAAALG